MGLSTKFAGRTALAALTAAIACALIGIPAAAATPTTTTVHTEAICFVVHNPGDPAAQALYGVRYFTATPTTQTRTIVLVHPRAPKAHRYWDLSPDFSAARNLARAGYQVIAYDRLGYERSPYQRPGGGHLVTATGGQEMLHEVVGQVHHGGFTAASNDACDVEHPGRVLGPATHSVVIGGNSLGGLIVSGYPGRYHDVDAAIQVGITNNGLSPEFVAIAAPNIAEGYLNGQDYQRLETDEASCSAVFLYPPGVQKSVADFCQGGSPATPAGEPAHIAEVYAINLAAIPHTGPGLPVLLAFMDHDEPVPTENAQAEFAYWKSACGCDVETWTQADAGHAATAHKTMPTFTAKVVSWLTSKGLGPSTVPAPAGVGTR